MVLKFAVVCSCFWSIFFHFWLIVVPLVVPHSLHITVVVVNGISGGGSRDGKVTLCRSAVSCEEREKRSDYSIAYCLHVTLLPVPRVCVEFSQVVVRVQCARESLVTGG